MLKLIEYRDNSKEFIDNTDDLNALFPSSLDLIQGLSAEFLECLENRYDETFDSEETILSDVLITHGKILATFAHYAKQYQAIELKRLELVEDASEDLKCNITVIFIIIF